MLTFNYCFRRLILNAKNLVLFNYIITIRNDLPYRINSIYAPFDVIVHNPV